MALQTALQLIDAQGRPCAQVPFRRVDERPRLDDLWFIVGSRCNLECIHCYVGSSPRNDALEMLALEEVERYLDEARRFGVRHVYFTGGEPFIHKDIARMLAAALAVAPASVLTNATAPLARHLDALAAVQAQAANPLVFRISLDHFDEARHDAIRGEGSFRKTLEMTAALARRGFRPIITSTAEVLRGSRMGAEEAARAYRELFARQGVEVEVKLLAATLEMGAQLGRIDRPTEVPFLTDDRLERLRVRKQELMCHNGRMVLKREGRTRVYPCPIIYEEPEYDLGATLEESFRRPVPLAHHACAHYCCRAGIGTCTN